jgi:hypothetical protein
MAKRSKDEKLAYSRSELARKCDVSRATARDWLRHRLWCLGGTPPWTVDLVREWRRVVLGWHRTAACGGASKDVREQRDLVSLESAKLQLDSMKGLLVPSDVVQAMAFDIGRWLRTEVVDLFRRLPGSLGGLDATEARRVLDDEQRRLLGRLAEKVAGAKT